MSPEAPRFVFAFGPTQDSYFVGCGEEMEWNNLPSELESILSKRTSSVISLSLGESGAFYCRYVSRLDGSECTASGGLPSNLSFLLSSWFADPRELPHIAFGPSGSFFFQSPALAAWEHLPPHLAQLLNELRESSGAAIPIPARCLALGANGSFVFLTGDEGEIPVWDDIDPELAHRLSGDEERNVVESAVLSLANREDYLIVFSDGSIFYSVPDSLTTVVRRFVRMYHVALAEYEQVQAMLYGELADSSRPTSPRMEIMAAMQNKGSGLCSGSGSQSLSLELPDGILGWDEDVLVQFIEEAVTGVSRSQNSSPMSSPPPPRQLGVKNSLPCHKNPQQQQRRRRWQQQQKWGLVSSGTRPVVGMGIQMGRGRDYAASWVESQERYGYDEYEYDSPLGMQLTPATVIEL